MQWWLIYIALNKGQHHSASHIGTNMSGIDSYLLIFGFCVSNVAFPVESLIDNRLLPIYLSTPAIFAAVID